MRPASLPWPEFCRRLAPFASLLILTSCAGGGTGTPPTLTVPLNPNARMFQKGDTATYTFTGTFTGTGLLPVGVTGSTVHTISDKVGDVLTVTHDLHIIIDGNP